MTAQALRVEEQAAPYLVAPLLTDQFDTFASAPEGFKRLRELVLNLAVRGRLVPQHPKDEPANRWLKEIATDSRRRLKADSAFAATVGEEGQSFELPAGWEWVRLGAIGDVGSSSRVHQKDWKTSGVPFYRAREIVKLSACGTVDNELCISEEHFRRLSQHGFVPEANDIMITGVGTIGVPYVVAATDKFYFKDASVLIFKNRLGLPTEFLFILMKSPYWTKQVHIGSMGTTVHTLTIGRLSDIPIPLPPLAEQSRIVAKVEELMALIDRLEEKVSRGDTARGKLLDTLLAALADSPDAAATADTWAQLAPHFDLLLQTPADVDRLQQTLLTLAVKGRLVPQDPKDEPAAELLKRIRAEKERLVAEGNMKRSDLAEGRSVGVSEELPNGWLWTSLGEVISLISGQHLKPGEYAEGLSRRIPYLTGPAEFGEASPAPTRSTDEQRAVAINGDILLTVKGSGVGKTNVVSQPSIAISRQLMAVRPILVNARFIHLVLRSAEDIFQANTVGIAIPGISREDVQNLRMGLPPLPEQSRIVSAVASLTALCDRLRERLAARRDLSAKLAGALTESALA